MKTSLRMSAGKLLFRHTGLLHFLCWMGSVATCPAQSGSVAYSFAERVQTRYASLFSPGSTDTIINGTTRVNGRFYWQKISDSVTFMKIETANYSSDFNSEISELPVLELWMVTNKLGELERLHCLPEMQRIALTHFSWILDWNASLNPQEGDHEYERLDGSIRYLTTQLPSQKGSVIVRRENPVIRSGSGGQQHIVLDDYRWTGHYSSPLLVPDSVEGLEYFRQFMGRSQLACVNRSWRFSKLSKAIQPVAKMPAFSFNPLKRMNAADRQRRIDENLLQNTTAGELLEDLKNLGEDDGTAAFRLTSRFRAYASQRGDPDLFDSLLQQLPQQGLQREIIENVVMLSTAPFAGELVRRLVLSCNTDYNCLRDLLVRVSLYADAEEGLLDCLQALLPSGHENTRSLVLLTISNLLLKIRETNPGSYNRQLDRLLQELDPGLPGQPDTLLYLQVIGNAGAEQELPNLQRIYEADSSFRYEVLISLRNMKGDSVEALIFRHLTHEEISGTEMTEILLGRSIPRQIHQQLVDRLLKADNTGDESFTGLLRMLVARRWVDEINLEKLEKHNFILSAYRDEWDEYKKELFRCTPG